MRSGRSCSKINCRNFHSDRKISLSMRALVRAKWSEVGGCLGASGLNLHCGKVGKKMNNYYKELIMLHVSCLTNCSI